MELRFTASGIGSGDAFLVESTDKNYLFDSGGSKVLLVSILGKKKITRLNLAVCSFVGGDFE